MSRFRNNADIARHYTKLDTNPEDYKSKDYHPYHPKAENDYEEGISIKFVDGSVFRSKQLTCREVDRAINLEHKQWLQLNNFSAINVNCIIHYEPYKFFNHQQDYKRRGNY